MQYDYFGSDYHLLTIGNDFISIAVTDLGANLVKVNVKNRDNRDVDVLLGYDTPDAYMSDDQNYIGAQLGRYANQISNAKFSFANREYSLDKNFGRNSLNGGFAPWSKRMYGLDKITDEEIIFNLISPDGDQGFPGIIDIEICYRLLENGFEVTYEAISTCDTIWNVTARNYFNLNGEGTGSILDHRLKLYSDFYLPTNNEILPVGSIKGVADTPMDFRTGKAIGQDIGKNFRDLIIGDGYCCCFVTDSKCANCQIHRIAEVVGDKTNIKLIIESDYPGVMLYSGQKLFSVAGKNKHIYNKHDGIVLVPQYFPNAVNIPYFEQPILPAGIRTVKTIRYLFER